MGFKTTLLKPKILLLLIVILLQLSQFFPLCFPPTSPSTPRSHSQSSQHLSMPVGHLHMFFDWFLASSFPPSLWSLSVCSMFSRLWFSCSVVYLVHYIPLISGIAWYLSSVNCLTSLSIIFFSSIHGVAKGRSSFFLLHSIPSCKCTTGLIHSCTDGHVGCSQHLAIVRSLCHYKHRGA